MYHNSFLDSKRYSKLHIENNSDVRNINLAPFIVEGGSVFKKKSFFLGSLVLGDNFREQEGQLVYRNGEFMGYNGEKWLSFTRENLWKDGENVLYVEGQRIGINRINPRKMLEVGGDAMIEKKLEVGGLILCGEGLYLREQQGRRKPGMLRFWENNFEGFNGEKWVRFGEQLNEEKEEQNNEVDLENVQRLELKDCPLIFKNRLKSYLWYDWEKQSYNMGRLHEGNLELIKRDNLWINNLKLDGDIEMQGKGTIRNVINPTKDDEVATKGYVDMVSQGLQNYMFVDFLCLEVDVVVSEKEDNLEIYLKRDIGNIVEGKLLGILMAERACICEVIGKGERILVKFLSSVQTPAKLCIKDGRYGNSEYFVYDIEDKIGYLQVNGMETLEYDGCLLRIGKKIKLNFDDIFEEKNEKLKLKYEFIDNNYLGEKCISSNNLMDKIVEARHLKDKVIGEEHILDGCITGLHIGEKTLGGKHMRDGFLKNNHFSAGIITDRELGNECVGMTNLKAKSILSKHMTKDAVNNENIKDLSIERRHLTNNLLDSVHIGEGIIMGNHLVSKVIESRHLGDGIITTVNLCENLIEGKHINEKGIEGRHLGIGIVEGLHIREDSVGNAHIKEQSVGEKHIIRSSIMDWHINDGQIRRQHLEEGCIDGSKLLERVIVSRHLSEQVVGQEHLRRGCVGGNHIISGSIDDRHLVNFSIKGNKLMEGIITETKLVDGCVSTGKIRDKSITNDKLKLSFIKMDVDPIFVCPQIVNLGDTLHLGLNSNYMIPKRRDGIVEFMGSVRFGEEGSGQTMEVNMEMDVKGNMKVNGEDIMIIGEVKGVVRGIKVDMGKWVKCDGKRVRRSDYYELYEKMGDIKEDGDEFYLPDIKQEGIDYYVRFKN